MSGTSAYLQLFKAMPFESAATTPLTFRTTVHGTVFGRRAAHVEAIDAGDPLFLIPDPPGDDDPEVWVHLPGGEPLGHLPPEINRWLAPWIMRGGPAAATTVRVGGVEVPSWKRLLIEIDCSPRHLLPTGS